MRSIVPALATLSLVASASAKVIHVPDACSTLADAVKAAVDGDEIVLAPMKHLAAAVEIGKEITIRSFDPTDREIVAQTIVMPPSDIAKYDVYAFRFEEVGSGALLDGLTIAHYGSKEKPSWAYSAVSIFRASPRIRNCVISDNYLVTAIGGLEIILGEPVIENCQIRYNHGPEAGGVYIGPFSRPRFLNTQIDNNDGSGRSSPIARSPTIKTSAAPGEECSCTRSRARASWTVSSTAIELSMAVESPAGQGCSTTPAAASS